MTGIVYPADAVGGAPSYTGRVLRDTLLAPLTAMATPSRPLGAHSGVRPGTLGSIVTATSTTWTVTPFAGIIDAEAAAAAGPYSYAFLANQTGGITAAAGSDRYDRLDVQISDPAEGDGTSNPLVTIIYTAGVPGAGVINPAAPPRSHRLTTILVPASGGGSPTVIWTPQYSAAAGGALPFNNSTELGLVNGAPAQLATTVSDNANLFPTLWMWDGSQWQRVAQAGASTPIVTFGTNWTAGTGTQVPKVQMNGNRVDLTGSVLLGAIGGGGGYTNILTVPAAFQPPSTAARFIGNAVVSSGVAATELTLTAGVLGNPPGGYSTGSLPFGVRIPLHCFWYMD